MNNVLTGLKYFFIVLWELFEHICWLVGGTFYTPWPYIIIGVLAAGYGLLAWKQGPGEAGAMYGRGALAALRIVGALFAVAWSVAKVAFGIMIAIVTLGIAGATRN